MAVFYSHTRAPVRPQLAFPGPLTAASRHPQPPPVFNPPALIPSLPHPPSLPQFPAFARTL